MAIPGIKIKYKNLFWLPALLLLLGACAAKEEVATPAPLQQQLRISNSGSTDINDLVVIFPGLNSEMEVAKLDFGDLPAGQTSQYQDAPTGVYRYAAYTYTLEGREITQAVTDWVGEGPMNGSKFTYQLLLDLKKPEGNQVRLAKTVVDAP